MKKVIDIYFGAKATNVLSSGLTSDIVTLAPHTGTIEEVISSLTSSTSRWVAVRLENDNIRYINVEKILWFETRDMKEDCDKTAEELKKEEKAKKSSEMWGSLFGGLS